MFSLPVLEYIFGGYAQLKQEAARFQISEYLNKQFNNFTAYSALMHHVLQRLELLITNYHDAATLEQYSRFTSALNTFLSFINVSRMDCEEKLGKDVDVKEFTNHVEKLLVLTRKMLSIDVLLLPILNSLALVYDLCFQFLGEAKATEFSVSTLQFVIFDVPSSVDHAKLAICKDVLLNPKLMASENYKAAVILYLSSIIGAQLSDSTTSASLTIAATEALLLLFQKLKNPSNSIISLLSSTAEPIVQAMDKLVHEEEHISSSALAATHQAQLIHVQNAQHLLSLDALLLVNLLNTNFESVLSTACHTSDQYISFIHVCFFFHMTFQYLILVFFVLVF